MTEVDKGPLDSKKHGTLKIESIEVQIKKMEELTFVHHLITSTMETKKSHCFTTLLIFGRCRQKT